jgi:glucose-6-phosphate 1-dehydrogenase
VRDQRVKVLEHVHVVDTFFGQYASYRQEEFVDKDSCTETFAAAYLRIANERWAGVPFYLKTGKCLDKKETVIHIKFKAVDCLLARCPTDANVLTISISPQAGFTLSLNAKKPGNANEIVPASMNFCHSCVFGARDEQAYETLLESVILGEKSVSVRFDEIEAAWNITDAIKKHQREVFAYACGSSGPEELELFNKKHGIRWLS